ncbi:tripartite tricarboxylate transporter TctB family protein [Oscillospiraceae bacterium PP1C4]
MKVNVKKVVLVGLMLVGLYWVIESLKLELWVRRGPGGGFLPLLAGALCILFSLIILLKEWKAEADTSFSLKALIPMGALLGVLVSSYLIGVFLSLIIFVFLWLFFFEKFSLKNSISVAIIWPSVLYSVFVIWLQAPLPKGLLGLL